MYPRNSAYINIFETLLPKNVEINEQTLIDKFDENLATIIVHLIHIWTGLTLKEKNIFISLIDKELKRKDIAEHLKVTTGSLSLSLKKIQKIGLITKKNNHYKIEEKLLARWLKKEYEKYEEYPYLVE